MNTRRRVFLGLATLALVCGVIGGVIGWRAARKEFESRNNPQTWNEHVSKEFNRLVKPTEEQGPRVKAHLDRAVLDLQAIRRETLTKSTNVIWRLVSEVEAELSPEQKKAFEAMKPKPGELDLDVLNTSSQ